MSEDSLTKRYTFSQIVAAVEIFQRAGYVEDMKKICDEIGFAMILSDPLHGQIISNYLNDALSGKVGPEPHRSGSEAHVRLARPCPCEDS